MSGKRALCICEQSKDMPWCDGSHARGVRPRIVDAAIVETGLILCECGRSAELPFCDGQACDEAKKGEPSSEEGAN